MITPQAPDDLRTCKFKVVVNMQVLSRLGGLEGTRGLIVKGTLYLFARMYIMRLKFTLALPQQTERSSLEVSLLLQLRRSLLCCFRQEPRVEPCQHVPSLDAFPPYI